MRARRPGQLPRPATRAWWVAVCITVLRGVGCGHSNRFPSILVVRVVRPASAHAAARRRHMTARSQADAPSVRALPPRTPSLLYAVKQLELAVRAHLDELLRPAAITVLQYTALTVLERRADLTTAELARNSFVTDQTMADMVTGLDDRGLIVRDTDPRDRRRRVIRLTPTGERLLDQF